jgi:DNA-binding NarL/FixJ family response regulator
VLVLSASDRPLAVRAAMRAGAVGYLLKVDPADEVRAAIRAAAAGQS